MQEELTKCQKMLEERYLDKLKSKEDDTIYLSIGMGANSFGFEEEIMEYLEAHPDATLQELDQYAEQFFPELVVEGDDDEDTE